jgi:hypothetical protein
VAGQGRGQPGRQRGQALLARRHLQRRPVRGDDQLGHRARPDQRRVQQRRRLISRVGQEHGPQAVAQVTQAAQVPLAQSGGQFAAPGLGGHQAEPVHAGQPVRRVLQIVQRVDQENGQVEVGRGPVLPFSSQSCM